MIISQFLSCFAVVDLSFLFKYLRLSLVVNIRN